MNQPITLAAAAILNVIIGLSGLVVGLTLVVALPTMAAASDVAFGDVIVHPDPALRARRDAGWDRHLAALLGRLDARCRGRRAGPRGADLGQSSLVGPDRVLLFGVVVWTLTLLLLAAPQTRRVLG